MFEPTASRVVAVLEDAEVFGSGSELRPSEWAMKYLG
jgi:hypothetical protein